jgi:hypothetical protein
VAIAILGTSALAMGIQWYTLTRSIFEKMVQPAMWSLSDCMLGEGVPDMYFDLDDAVVVSPGAPGDIFLGDKRGGGCPGQVRVANSTAF